jgi:tungstate transport system substrate-binding protein
MKVFILKCTVLFILIWSSLALAANGDKFIFLSSTIGPIDAGIVGALEDKFEKDTGIRVRHVGAGTGAALDIARKCNIDLVLVHAKSLEEKFIADGFGTERIPLMYNDFVIVGPATDPAAIKGTKTAAEALKKIMDSNSLFISRGDKSGTHVAEMELWGKAGMSFMKRELKAMFPHSNIPIRKKLTR